MILWATLLVTFGLVATACSSAEVDTGGLTSAESTTTTTTTNAATSSESSTAADSEVPTTSAANPEESSASEDVEANRTGAIASDDEPQVVRRSRTNLQVASDDDRLLVAFSGVADSPRWDPCATEFEIEAVESDDRVEVSVVELMVSPEAFAGLLCTDAVGVVAAQISLDESLGDRPVSTGGQVLPVADAGQLRYPTEIPEVWEPLPGGDFNEVTGGRAEFGPVVVTIRRADREGASILDVIAGNPASSIIDVVGTGDGRVVTRASDGLIRLGFIDGDWSYDILAPATSSQFVVTNFAQSFAVGHSYLVADRESAEREVQQVEATLGFALGEMVASPVAVNVASVDGARVVIDEPESRCEDRLQIVVDETATDVTVSAYRVHPEAVAGRPCAADDRTRTITLTEPLSDRILLGANGEPLVVGE